MTPKPVRAFVIQMSCDAASDLDQRKALEVLRRTTDATIWELHDMTTQIDPAAQTPFRTDEKITVTQQITNLTMSLIGPLHNQYEPK